MRPPICGYDLRGIPPQHLPRITCRRADGDPLVVDARLSGSADKLEMLLIELNRARAAARPSQARTADSV